MLCKHESFFCSCSIAVPSWSLACESGHHVSARSSPLSGPYAFSFLPCIWVGAPAYTFIQRDACGPYDACHLGTHTDGQGYGRGQHDAWRPELVAGASFIAGRAGDLQEGAALPSPHPSFQKRQSKMSWSSAGRLVGYGSFLLPWSRVGIPAPRVRGIFGFCFLGIWDRSGGAKLMICMVLRSAQVLRPKDVRRG